MRGTPPPACSPGIRHCEEQSDEAIHSRGFLHPLAWGKPLTPQ